MVRLLDECTMCVCLARSRNGGLSFLKHILAVKNEEMCYYYNYFSGDN